MTRAKDISKILTDANISGTLDVTGETTLATHLNLGDNDKIKLGASGDLEIYHDTNHSYIEDTGTGELRLKTNGTAIRFQHGSETMSLYTEDGSVELFHNDTKRLETSANGVTVTGGLTTTTASSIEGGVVFNEASADVDFRVESNGNANMLFVNGGNDTVGIGHSGSTATLDVRVAGTASLGIGSTNASGASIYLDGDSNGDFSGSDYSYITHDSAGRLNIIQDSPSGTNHLRLYTAASERFRIDGDGAVSIHTLGVNPVSQSGNTDAGGTFFANAAYIAFARIGGVVSYFNRQYSDGDVIAIRQDGSDEGTISVSGTTVSYNAFSGSHWSRLIDNSKPTVLKGTVIETIDEMCDWYQVKITIPKTEDSNERTIKDSIALPEGKKVGDTISHTYEDVTYDDAVIIKEGDNKHPKCKISDTADSKRIYGVHADWDNDDDTVNDMYVTAVGTHVVRINKDVTVSAGDLLSSNGDGTAKVQDDDIIRSKTIGKVLTNLKQETYSDGSYTVPCALYCG